MKKLCVLAAQTIAVQALNCQQKSIFKHSETREISQEQLVAEVKGIYAELVTVESRCIDVDSAQMDSGSKLNNEQWQLLIALHRLLLHKHHDFLLASQHPPASRALRKLARKYAVCIFSFFSFSRSQLPNAS